MNENTKTNSRREFLRNSALATGGLLTLPYVSDAGYFNSVDDTIKVALIGCGGRGTGAAMQALLSKQNVKLVAMADAVRTDRSESLASLVNRSKESFRRYPRSPVSLAAHLLISGSLSSAAVSSATSSRNPAPWSVHNAASRTCVLVSFSKILCIGVP